MSHRALVTRVLLLISLCALSAGQATHEWDVQITTRNTTDVASLIAPGTPYSFYVRVRTVGGAVDPVLTAALSRVGQVPRFSTTDATSVDIVNRNWELSHNPDAGYWLVPFTTSRPGLTTLTVSGKAISVPGVVMLEVEVIVSVSPMFVFNVTGDETYQNLLGSVTASLPGGATTNFNNGRGFKIDGIPTFSPLTYAVLNPSTTTIAYSSNNFMSSTLVTIDQGSFLGGRPAVCGSFSGILQALDVVNATILLTPSGVVRQNLDSTFTNVLNHCIAKLAYPQQSYPPQPDFNLQVFALSDTAPVIYISKDGGATDFYEPKDKLDRTLSEVFNLSPTSRIIDASAALNQLEPSLRGYPITAMVNADGTYALYRYTEYMTGPEWELLYKFPLRVPQSALDSDARRIYQDVNEQASIYSIVPLGLRFSVDLSETLYVYGTQVLLESLDGGQSMHLLHTSSSSIVEVVTDKSGGVTALTSNNEVWYSLDSQPMVQVVGARSSSPLRTLFLDGVAGVFEMTIFPNSATAAAVISREDSIRGQISSSLRASALASGSLCPYSRFRISAPLGPEYSRSLEVAETVALPRHIYLDYGDSYPFTVAVTPGAGFQLEDMHFHFQVPETDLLSVAVTRTLDYGSNRALFHVNVTDNREIFLISWSTPGTGYRTIPLTIQPSQNSYLCEDLLSSDGDDGRGARVVERTLIHLGCPRDRRLEFVPKLSLSENEGCTQIPGETCLYFANDFTPVLHIVDEVTNVAQEYRGLYIFKVIGGGPTRDDIERYTEDEIEKYNLGTATIWTNAEGDSTSELSQDKGNAAVSWVCAPGSPCASPAPRSFGKTPEYYVVIEFTTAAINLTSYCNYTHHVVVRIHGIAMGFQTTLSLTFGTFGGLVLITWLFYCGSRLRHRDQVSPAPQATAGGVPARSALFG